VHSKRSPLLSLFLLSAIVGLGHVPRASAQSPGVAESSSFDEPSGTSLCAATSAQQQAALAVIRIPSHGISGSVVATSPGKSYILTCAHGHYGRDGNGRDLRTKPMAFDVPHPTPDKPQPAKSRVRAIGRPDDDDLVLIEFDVGPLPYVCPIAPRAAGQCKVALSVGYDEMKWPMTERPATVLTRMTETRERPWHGRSGGALINEAGHLVGVCHGYSGPRARDATRGGTGTKPNFAEVARGGAGIYVSHETIVAFLDRSGYGWLAGGDAGAPPPNRAEPRQLGPQQAPQRPLPQPAPQRRAAPS